MPEITLCSMYGLVELEWIVIIEVLRLVDLTGSLNVKLRTSRERSRRICARIGGE